MALLQLIRPDEKANCKGDMAVILDNNQIGSIANGSKQILEVEPGNHSLKIKIDSQGSKVCRFNIKQNEKKSFVLFTNKNANNLEAWGTGGVVLDLIITGVLLLYYFTVGHNRYLKIQELDKHWR